MNCKDEQTEMLRETLKARVTVAQIHGVISGEAPGEHRHQNLRNLKTGERESK